MLDSRLLKDVSAAPAAAAPRWYWHPYNRALLYRLAGTLGWLPRGGRLVLARALGGLAPWWLPAERAAVRLTLEAVTGATGARLDALTKRLFGEFAMCFTDLLTTNRQPPSRLSPYVEQMSGTERVSALTGGLVTVTAHVGNWEMAGRLLATSGQRTTHIVASPDELPELERWVRRDGDGLRFVPRAHAGIGVELVAALRRGDVVALQGDRGIGTRGDVMVPFFGRLAPFPIGPFVLARAAGVPVVPAFCLLGRSHRYHVRIAAPMSVERGEEEAAVRTWVALLEDVVREHPTQWFNFFDVWHPYTVPGA